MTVSGPLSRLDAAAEAVSAALMGALSILVFVGVVYRYVLLSPIAWVEEIVRFCLVWVTFVGGYLALRRGQHIAMELVHDHLGPAGQRAADAVSTVLLAVFFLVLAWHGTRYALVFMEARSPYLGFPQGLTYFALPVGAVLLLLALGPACARAIRPAPDDGGARP